MKFLLSILLFTSCQQASNEFYLKSEINRLEIRVDSLVSILNDKKAADYFQQNKSGNKKTLAKKKLKNKTPILSYSEPATYTPTVRRSSSSNNYSSTSQCNGITKKGYRCSRMVKGGGNCWQH